jgi:hypothetical protein
VEFDPVQLESAISSTIFEIVEDEDSVFDAATQASKHPLSVCVCV